MLEVTRTDTDPRKVDFSILNMGYFHKSKKVSIDWSKDINYLSLRVSSVSMTLVLLQEKVLHV